MRPPLTVPRRMWISIVIGELVMDAVGGYPENGPTFQSQRGADSQAVLDRFRALVPAMGKEPVITHTNAQATRDPPEEN